MSYPDNRKYKKCACGGDLPIFGRKCEKCTQKTWRNVYFHKIKIKNNISKDLCTYCHKKLCGEIVDFEGGRAHNKCWLRVVYS